MSPIYLESLPIEEAISKSADRNTENLLREKQQDERVFYIGFVLSFPLFLVVALAGRILPGHHTADDSSAKSIFAEASSTTRATIAIALTN